MKMLRKVGLSIIAGAAAMTAASGAMAQISLNDVLNAARAERRAVAEENREREARFVAERNTQRTKLAEIRSKVNAETAKSNELDSRFAANLKAIEESNAALREKQGEFAELFGAARSAAGEFAAQLDNSIISAEFPGRAEALRKTASSDTLPTVEQLEGLYFTFLQEMVEQSKVATFSATVKKADGTDTTANVTRIGPFSSFSKGRFLTYDSDLGKLEFLARQPVSSFTDAARKVENFKGKGYARGPIDPSLGTLLKLTLERATPMEVYQQGGVAGYAITVLFAIGALIGLYKLVTLWGVGGAVRSQMRKKNAGKGNPLGRIMMAYQSNTNADVETVALKLDDAVLKEVPKLEGGLNLVKVAAAVAPLLGLLGTVIGMIETFQMITLFGAGDPQMMADGISKALVTTMLGLIAAIPLLLIHAFASGSAKSVSQVLEEQAAGMIAEHAESK
ncbi:MAG: MotA/TolQ/ExbB proton channel family protein [bacterium]